MDLMSLVATVSLDTSRFIQGINEIKGQTSGLSSVSVAIGNLMSQGFNKAVGAVKNFGSYVMSAGQTFEATMSEVQAISGASADDMTKLSDKAQEMGAKTKFSASEAGEAFTYMAMAGWKTGDMLDGVEGIMSLAAASGEDLATTSDIVTDALTAFGLTAGDSGKFADVLAAASSNANTNVAMLGESFKYVAPVVGALFQDAAGGSEQAARDTAVALGLMANAGIKASQGGTALRTIMTNLVKPTDEMQVAMDELGISVDDADGNMYSFRQIMDNLRESFGHSKISEEEFNNQLAELDEGLRDGTITQKSYDEQLQHLVERAYGAEGAMKAQYAATLAGKTGMSGLLAIVNASEEDYNKLTSAVDNSSQVFVRTTDGSIIPMTEAIKDGVQWTEEFQGSAQAMSAVMQGNLSGSTTILKSNLESLALTFYNGIAGTAQNAVSGLTQAVGKMTEKVKEWIKSDATQEKLGAISEKIQALIDKLVRNLDPILDGVIGLFNALVDAIGFAADHFDQIVGVIGTVISVFVGLKAAMAAIKFVSMISGIASLIASMNPVTLIIGAIIAAIGVLIANWDTVKSVAIACWNSIKSAWNAATSFFSNLVSGIVKAFTGIGEKIGSFFSSAWEKVKSIWSAVTSWFSSIVSAVINAFTSIPSRISAFFQNAWNSIKNVWQAVTGWFSSLVSAVINAFTSIPSRISSFFSNAWSSIQSAWNGVVSWFSSLVSNVINAFTSVPSRISSFFSNAWNSVKNAWNSATSWFKSIGTNVINAFTSIPSRISSFFSNAWNNVKNVWSNVTSFFSGIPNKIYGVFTSLPSRFSSIGKEIVQGLWNGINNMVGWITGKVKGFTDSVVGSFKNFFGIKSPSRVMREEVGKYLGMGVGEGIMDEADYVQKSFDSLMPDFGDAKMFGGFGTSGSDREAGNNYTITINVNGAKYNDERSLAEAISEELQSMINRRRAVFA